MESTNLAGLAAAILVCCFSMAIAQRSCLTLERQPGRCVSIDDCEPIARLTRQRPLPTSTFDLLRRSRCGFQGNTPWVCCATGGNTNTGGGGGRRTNEPPRTDNRGGGNNQWNYGGNRDRPASLTGLDSHPNARLLPTDRCGVDLADKIIGGEEANLKEYPWLALLEYQTREGRQFLCGGSLISNRYVLTAAHCVTGIGSNKLINVRLGEHNTKTNPDCQAVQGGQLCGDPVQDYGIAENIPHAQYNPNSNDRQNDIALIRLDRTVSFTDYIAPICIPWGDALTKTYENNRLIVSGWGRTETGSNSDVKLWVKVPVMPNPQCAPIYVKQLTLTANQLCAGGVKNQDSCRGDSGGPLMNAENVIKSRPGAQWVITGIVSVGPRFCGTEGRPGIYTRVGPYVSWILDTIKP